MNLRLVPPDLAPARAAPACPANDSGRPGTEGVTADDLLRRLERFPAVRRERPAPNPILANFAAALQVAQHSWSELFPAAAAEAGKRELLLAAYCAAARDGHYPITRASTLPGVPVSVVLRWAASLLANGMFERVANAADPSAVCVRLSEESQARLETWLNEAHVCFQRQPWIGNAAGVHDA